MLRPLLTVRHRSGFLGVRRADGHTLAFFNPYFQVRLPSRFYDPALAPVVGRPIAVCYEVTPDGQVAGLTFATATGRRSGIPMPSAGTGRPAVRRLDPPAAGEDGQQ